MTTNENADVVVVGAGTAGAVVVRRLVDAGHRVAVIEAGPTDASIMPTTPAGNTAAPTLMIGERAADLILGNR